MGNHYVVLVETSAQTKKLICDVIIGSKIAKNSSRFRIAYDWFNQSI